jgi:hypothetical protein
MTCWQNNLEAIIKCRRGQTPPSPSNATLKREKTSTNTICVKQPSGKDFTISLSHPPNSPRNNNKPKVTLTTGKDHGPVSIVIHSTPKNKTNTHPCFNTSADRKSNAIIDVMKEKLSYKIHSPADNLKISLVGDTLAEVIGNSKSYPAMLLKGGGRGCSPPRHNRGDIKSPTSPKSPISTSLQDQYNSEVSNNSIVSNGSNIVQLSMPGSGVKLNIKIGKGTQVSYGGSPTTSCNDFEYVSPKSGSTCESQNCNKSCNDNIKFPIPQKFGGYSQPTISSLISSRMTQLKREMSMNSLIPHAPAPAPPFINF